MQHLFLASVLTAATVGSDVHEQSVAVRVQATVLAPLEVQVLNDQERQALDQPVTSIRVYRDLNSRDVRVATASSATNWASL